LEQIRRPNFMVVPQSNLIFLDASIKSTILSRRFSNNLLPTWYISSVSDICNNDDTIVSSSTTAIIYCAFDLSYFDDLLLWTKTYCGAHIFTHGIAIDVQPHLFRTRVIVRLSIYYYVRSICTLTCNDGIRIFF